MSSGMNVGYWSLECEEWYQTRRDLVISGPAHPKAGDKWRTSLQRWKPRKKFTNGVQIGSSLVFDGGA